MNTRETVQIFKRLLNQTIFLLDFILYKVTYCSATWIETKLPASLLLYSIILRCSYYKRFLKYRWPSPIFPYIQANNLNHFHPLLEWYDEKLTHYGWNCKLESLYNITIYRVSPDKCTDYHIFTNIEFDVFKFSTVI